MTDKKRKKEEELPLLKELRALVKKAERAVRHRKGISIPIPRWRWGELQTTGELIKDFKHFDFLNFNVPTGKKDKNGNKVTKQIHIPFNNEIPAIVEDVFRNLGYKNKDDEIPEIVQKQQYDWGWFLMINLPAGFKWKQVQEDLEYFTNKTGSFIKLKWNGKALLMDVLSAGIPDFVRYWEFNIADQLNKGIALPVPLGVSYGNEVVCLDLVEVISLMIAGRMRGGKSILLFCVIMTLVQLPWVRLIVTDVKGNDYQEFTDHVDVITGTEAVKKELLPTLEKLWKEQERRAKVLGKMKIRELTPRIAMNLNMPYVVVIIDELTEAFKNKKVMEYVESFARLTRAYGIYVITATQRTSAKAIPTEFRDIVPARASFYQSTADSSRMILGDGRYEAHWLPADKPGRGVYVYGETTKVFQSYFLDFKQERTETKRDPEIVRQILSKIPKRKWSDESVSQSTNPNKSLKPRQGHTTGFGKI